MALKTKGEKNQLPCVCITPLIVVFSLQDEFLDVVYWFRQIIAVILGVIWGVAPLKGFLGIIM